MTGRVAVPPGSTVMEVPADTRSLRALRLVVADAAAAVGFSVDRVRSASAAVDELAAVLISDGGGERLTVIVDADERSVDLSGSVTSSLLGAPDLDRPVRLLLDACVGPGAWRLFVDGGHLCFEAQVRP